VRKLLPDKPEIDRGERNYRQKNNLHSVNMVQDVTCRFGILGRVFGFGDLEIESAGTYGKIVFSFISNPSERKEEIGKAILEFKANRKNYGRKRGQIEP
jgi:hypothetical protein